MPPLAFCARFALVLSLLALPVAAMAQGRPINTPLVIGEAASPILTLESDRLFAESAFGRRIQTELEAARNALVAENQRITAELTEEEQNLTDRRGGMDPAAFRVLADAFDEKVQRFRDEQDEKARTLDSRNEEARRVFILAARPEISALLRETGAALIVERRIVIVSADAVDITDMAVERIDAAIGDGAGLLELEP
ncbi:OmpH family outer membrane protein [Puniceibacterium sediminis]|uniref:Periplasmic chaperone for outer membrane proteins Skp n=1 Tax=Puniceibacterium sediminis TaxID=1608407 RepID=A0A238W2L1_9RHOB|nr:OmpH family outer membrane protein [Puniceibacterium sediminis]SNR39949.1 periplasmic chaperone for outer membrane proteins Skp [Puniceibacterium sediminis]